MVQRQIIYIRTIEIINDVISIRIQLKLIILNNILNEIFLDEFFK